MAGQNSIWRETVETAVLTLVVFLAVRVALQNFKVEGESMMPTLQSNEYVLVNKIDYLVAHPRRGDIVVFRAVPAGQPTKDFVKRIIGLPGDTVSVRNNAVYVNGHRLKEPYELQPPDYDFVAHKVPANSYFVLGDNRNNSFDSHLWPVTFLPRRDIIGKAWISYWPPPDLHLFQVTWPSRWQG